MLKLLPIVVALAAGLGVVGGVLGYHGLLNGASPDFRDLWQTMLFRPPRFIAAWGVHLGGYVGGLIGAIAVVLIIRRKRVTRKSAHSSE
jgi:membrane associated rhomboid family serine protease